MPRRLKKYQPDRKDILINSEWGVPEDELTPGQAGDQELELFAGNWVRRGDREILNRQKRGYQIIRLCSLVYFLDAAVNLWHLLHYEFSHSFPILMLGTRDAAMSLSTLKIAIFQLIVGIGIFSFRYWARRYAIICSALGIFTYPLGLMLSLPMHSLIIVFLLVSKTSKEIFVPARKDEVPLSPVESKAAQWDIVVPIALMFLGAILIFEAGRHQVSYWSLVLVAGYVIELIGCYGFTKWKKCHPAWALMALLMPVGPFVLLVMPRQQGA